VYQMSRVTLAGEVAVPTFRTVYFIIVALSYGNEDPIMPYFPPTNQLVKIRS
jgi:hypothetical protein